MHYRFGLLLALLAPATSASAQHIIGVRDSQASRVDSVFRAFDRTDSPGCAVGVWQDGALRYGRGYGMASLEHGVALSPRSVLDIGSISKQFTAMAYHPAGRHLYATSNDTTVHVFDTATWERVTRFTWHLGRLKAVAVSPDGTLAAAGGDNGDIVIWDVDV